jgi:heme O synthase-like polyprenyltransferase
VPQLALARSRSADYLELTKPNIVGMILVTVAAGFYLAGSGGFDVLLLLHTLLGSAMVAAGSNALNQVLERRIDARMRRTQNRPLPAGRLRVTEANLVAWTRRRSAPTCSCTRRSSGRPRCAPWSEPCQAPCQS